jgi:hypothetical protein
MKNMQIIRDISGTTTVCLSYDIESPFARAYFLAHPECTKIEGLTGYFSRDGVLYGEVDLDAQRRCFARMLWEADAVLDQGALDDMADSMSLEPAELQELFVVAIKVFEKEKEERRRAVLEA